jgi:hypothetical protein
VARTKEVAPTEQDLIDAIRAAMSGSSDGENAATTQELRDATGLTERVICRTLRDLQGAGKLEVVQVYRTNLANVTSRRPGYRLRGPQ